MKTSIEISEGDITKVKADVIVNAANSTLLGGGGVDGAIHRAAGQDLQKECRTLNGCQKGEAKITNGYNLPAKYIIHTVGPVYGQEDGKEDEILKNCYKNSLELARKNNLKSIAFPAISTGCYKFPRDKAAIIVMETISDFIENNPKAFEKIMLILYSDLDLKIYQKIIEKGSVTLEDLE